MELFDKLEIYSKNISIIDENFNTYTYKELLISADKLGKKINKRETIFLICENSYEFISSYVGLVRRKVVIFLINNSINKKKLEFLVKHYKPNYVLIPKEKKNLDIKLNKIVKVILIK